MARLVTQQDIDLYGAAIIANGQKPMVLNDYIIFTGDTNSTGTPGNLLHFDAMPARLGATIWIQGGSFVYGALQFGRNFLTDSSSTSVTMSGLTIGGSVTMNVGTGHVLPVGHLMRFKSSTASVYFMGTIQSYSSGSVTINNISEKTGSGTFSNWLWVVEQIRSDASNPVHVHFFGARGQMDFNTTRTYEWEIWNINYLVCDFETNQHPGLRDGWGSGMGGKFGFRGQSASFEASASGFKVDNALCTGKRVHIRGLEMTSGGFAKLRPSLTANNNYEEYIIERCFLERSFRGEGIYLGLTTSGPWPTHKNLIVRDNLIVFTAAEAIQLQQCADGTRVYNNLVFVADHDYRSAFQADQDTAIQLDLVQGDVWFYNNLIYTFGKNGLNIFAKNASGQGTPYGNGVTKIFNNSWSGTKRQISMRTDASFDFGAKIVFRHNDVTSAFRMYDDVGVNRDYHFEAAGDTPVVQIGETYPNDGVKLHDTGDLAGVTYFNTTRADVAEPVFVNSGFDNIDTNRITKWHIEYTLGIYFASSSTSINPATLVDGGTVTFTASTSNASYQVGHKIYMFSRAGGKSFYGTIQSYVGAKVVLNNISDRVGSGAATDWNLGKRIPYTTADYVWLMKDETSIPVELYKCIQNHDAHDNLQPNIAPTYWQKVWWDSKGKNRYDPLCNGVSATTDYMKTAGDFRLVKGSYHHLKGRGLSCNEQREDMTQYGWEWMQTSGGTIREIPGAYRAKLVIKDYSYLWAGRYYRFWVKRMRSDGTYEAKIYSPWQVVT
jgi:hypothetical protein